jgi:signal transduction histidine kinase
MEQSLTFRTAVWQNFPLRLITVSGAYFLAGVLGLAAPFTNTNVSPIWLPAGVALAAVLNWGYRAWPAVALGAFLVNYTTHIPLAASLGIAAGNTASAVAAAFLLRRVPQFSTSLARMRDVLALLVCGCLAGTVLAATIGVGSMYMAGVKPWSTFTTAWLVWWLGDAMGVLLISPLLMTARHRVDGTGRWLEKMALGLLAAAATLVVFDDRIIGRTQDDVLAFIVFPFVIWAAIRFGQRGVAFTIATVAAISVWETATGNGPLVRHGGFQDVAYLQLFLAVIAISGFLLAAAVLERKEAEAALAREQELLRARERAEQALIQSEKLAVTGRIAATMAHEINNPLAAITNLVYLLESDDLPARAKAQVAILANEVKRISHITKQTLGFYRQPTKPTEIALDELVDELLEIYKKHLDAKGALVEKEYRSTARIEGYRSEIQQVVANLVLNACDAVEQGGRITITIEDTDANRVQIIVADSGEGVSVENQQRMFEPFFSTKHEKGVGLGLWVSRGIVHKHGGELTYSDQSSSGERLTQFCMVLPRRFPHPANNARSPEKSSSIAS